MAAGVGISGPILFRDVGWVCLGMGTHPTHPWHGTSEGRGWVPTPLGHGIQWDTFDKRVVRILLQCFLFIFVFSFFQSNGRKLENNDVTESFLGDKIVLILRVRIFVRPLYVLFATKIMQHHFSYLLFHMFTTCLGYEPGLMYQYFIDYITVIKAMFSYGKYWALV